jgi:two-component system, cell cycle response regulator
MPTPGELSIGSGGSILPLAVSWDDTTQVKAPPTSAASLEPKRDQAYLIVLAGSSLGEMFKIGRDRMVIGRGATADVRMIDEGVSREHCEVLMEGDKVILRDLKSTNGTFCRGVQVDRQELVDGDKILVGTGTVLKFTYHDKLDEDFQRQMLESVLRDDLTKAFNKKYFLDRLESEFAYAVRHNVPAALVAFDIDHFKQVNDSHGHPAGDLVLIELAAAVAATVRVEDVFARVGGEEFSVICRGADLMQGKIVAERIRYAVEKHSFAYEGTPIPVTVSVGVAAVPTPSIRDANELISAADQMLYEAKRAGRNRVSLWNR